MPASMAREVPPLSPRRDLTNREMWLERQHKYPFQCMTIRGRVRPDDASKLFAWKPDHFARFPFKDGDQWGFYTAEQFEAFKAKFGEFIV